MPVKSSPVIVLDPPAQAEKWESEDEFEARLNRIQSKVTTSAEGSGQPDSEEVATLRSANAQLKQLVEEARRRVQQLEAESEKNNKNDAEIERMLEEKSEEIRKLQIQVEEYKAKQSSGVTEEELIALHAELERERATLDEDRQGMEQQFRQLELSMSRERAEIARERNELQRTKAELKLKLDTVEKNIQTDMSPLRKLRDELRGEQHSAPAAPKPGLPALPTLPALNRRAPEHEAGQRSGIMSRFLGKKNDQR